MKSKVPMTKPPSPLTHPSNFGVGLGVEQRSTIERALEDAIMLRKGWLVMFGLGVETIQKHKDRVEAYRAILRQIREGKS